MGEQTLSGSLLFSGIACGSYPSPFSRSTPPPPPFSKIPSFLEIQDVPTFYRPIRKTKVLNDSFNWFLYVFYPQSILILEEYLQKLWNANYQKWVSVWQRYVKLLLETVTYIATTETVTSIITIEIVKCIMHCRK